MLRKIIVPAVIAAGAAGAIGAASAASDSGDDGDGAAQQVRIGIVTSQTKVDTDQNHRDSVGDLLIFHSEVRNGSETRTPGTAQSACTVTEIRGTALTAHCTGTIEFADGTLELAGLLHSDSSSDRFAIVGGTGRYDAADGQVTVTVLDETRTRLRVAVDVDD
jgi:Dirigent-like protein